MKLLQSLARGLASFSGFYEGANQSSSERTSISAQPMDAKQTATVWTRNALCGIARNLYGNVGFVKGTVDDIARYSVGRGIIPLSACDDEEIGAIYDDYWRTWSRIPEVTQRFNFGSIQRLTSKAVDVDGDVLFLLTETDTGYPQIQAIEAHRVASETDRDDYYDGVRVNDLGRAVAFSVRTKTPFENSYTRFPASDCVHVFEPERFSGFRGISGLKHGTDTLRDIKDIIGFEKTGVKINSAIAMVIELASLGGMPGGFFGGQETTEKDKNDAPITFEALRGGLIPKLLMGEKLTSHTSDRPNVTFGGFIQDLRREVATGLGVPIECVWDPSDLGGTNQRFVLEKFQRRCEERQETIEEMTFRFRTWVIAKGVKRGDLPFTPDWWKVSFQGPSKITVDVGREAKADRDDVEAGLRTLQEDYGGRGKHWKIARKDNQTAAIDLLDRAVAMKAKYASEGLTLQMALDLLQKRGNSGSPPADASQPKDTAKADKAATK